MAATCAIIEELTSTGAFVFAGGLMPPSSAITVDNTGESLRTVNDPFVEAPECLGGFWMIDGDAEGDTVGLGSAMARARPVTFEPTLARNAYASAGTAFVELSARVPDDAWGRPGLGEWTVRDLIGHTTRSFVTVSDYLATGAGMPVSLDHPFDYARIFVMAHADPEAITERGRAAGRELGERPVDVVASRRDAAVAAVDTHPDDAPVDTPAGVMTLVDYLPSRIFELVVHTDDLARALRIEHVADAASRTIATTFLAGIVAETGDSAVVLRALTGRGDLPEGFTALQPSPSPSPTRTRPGP